MGERALPRRPYQGLGSAGVPIVGVEPTRVEQSAIPAFQRYRLSTVDGVDTPVARSRSPLVLADPGRCRQLRRPRHGRPILPPIEPLPATSG